MLFILFVISVICLDIPLPNPEGNPDPSLFYERYRRDLYKKDPFYQWWYFWLRDLETNDHYAFSYGYSDCDPGTTCDYEGVFVMFSRVSAKQNNSFVKYEKYDLSDLVILDKDSPYITISNGKFGITPIDDSHYILYGEMNSTDNIFYVHDISEDVKISWNLTVERIYGWYGQHLFELADEWIKGMIMWNTYGHTSKFFGSSSFVNIGGDNIEFDESDRYRAYCDENWGTQFPSGPEGDRDYCWGWYVVNEPRSVDLGDFSFAAGVGQSDSQTFLGVMVAKFADIRVNSSYELSLRQAEIRKDDKLLDEHFYSSTDGELKTFDITRTEWVDYEDELGKASFPLKQSVHIETKHFDIHVNFSSQSDSYNRLIFPYQNDIFSDFEGLGVEAALYLLDKTNGKETKINSYTAGVEYGYKFKTNKP